jgi:isocitrate/isopropylmalate dehydrogenase
VTIRVAVIPGDDAAPEAMAATMVVLRALDIPVEWVVLPDGPALSAMGAEAAERLLRQGIDSCDTVLFGSTNGTTGGIGYLRYGKRTFANVRPVRWRPGLPSPLKDPTAIDYVIVRENLEDLYVGLEGTIDDLRRSGLPCEGYSVLMDGDDHVADAADGRYAVKVVTQENVERVARFASDLALRRRGRLTIGAKWNVLPQSDGYFREVVRSVVDPAVELQEYLADDLARRLVASPGELDVVLLPNLYGDLFSDEGAATVGGLGVCPSGCYGESSFAYFEPVHGTAPDIAGRRLVNPIATLLSAAMLLAHVGLEDAARRLEAAVDGTIADGGCLTPDIGGSATTDEVADAVVVQLAKLP